VSRAPFPKGVLEGLGEKGRAAARFAEPSARQKAKTSLESERAGLHRPFLIRLDQPLVTIGAETGAGGGALPLPLPMQAPALRRAIETAVRRTTFFVVFMENSPCVTVIRVRSTRAML
jgi:hypothetical protein